MADTICEGTHDYAKGAGHALHFFADIGQDLFPGPLAGLAFLSGAKIDIKFGDYIVEGFVPFEQVKKMMTMPFNFKGLAMPGMPMDIPDMGFDSAPGTAKMTYTTYAFTADGKEPTVYATYPSS